MAGHDSYRRRVVDEELDQLLPGLAAISIEGPRSVGKTATASQRAAVTYGLDDARDVALLQADPDRLKRGPFPALVDEWQRWPPSWDVIRRAVDDDRTPGRFLLTGSTSLEAPQTHTGAGRIVSLRMRPMTTVERGLDEPRVSLAALLQGGRPAITGESRLSLQDHARAIVTSGFPGILDLPDRLRRAQLDSYVERLVDRDLEEAGLRLRNPAVLRRWLTAYAAATSTTATYEAVRDAATGGESDKPARSRTLPYRDALERLWIVEPVWGWLPSRNRVARLSSSPKHHLADPGLAAALLGVDEGALLDGEVTGFTPRDGTLLGALFESLVTLDVRVFAQAAEARVGHLRTKGGEHEVDLMVERRDGRVLALEVKLTRAVKDDDVRHLLWLERTIGPDLLDMVVVTTGRDAYRRTDGVAVVPAGLLGP